MSRYTAYQVPAARNGAQIIRDELTGQCYISLPLYADLIGDRLGIDTEQKISQRTEKGKIIYLGEKGFEGIKGKYLISVDCVLQWMLIDNPQKAIVYAIDCVKESLIAGFNELQKKR